MNEERRWKRYQEYLIEAGDTGVALDVSRVQFPDDFLSELDRPLRAAFDHMESLEGGAIANPDEHRMVGHYWLRAPERAPDPEIARTIVDTIEAVEQFVRDVHTGQVSGSAGRFSRLLLIGIGGSALGPQLVADALGGPDDRMAVHFIDNTDPDGMERVFQVIGSDLGRTLVAVVSKSGGTRETRNGMLEARRRFAAQGLSFARHAVAVTGEGSRLHELARQEDWLAVFPMWDWVGGRTSVTSAVGLLPAALQGVDIRAFLQGAAAMDEQTRVREVRANPAALLTAAWYHCAGGRGAKDLVVLPYKDRLLLFSRYLQQLVMESLGKRLDLRGVPVHQGLTVYGNKGSTDQHAFVQQLREGIDNFFVTFIRVLRDGGSSAAEVEPGVTAGDYLDGFLLGTRQALMEAGRDSILLVLDRLDAFTLGALIALFERTVGLYAHLVGINAYHQPGVEAGKRAAEAVIALQRRLLDRLAAGASGTAEQLAGQVENAHDPETVYHVLEHLAANGRARVLAAGAPAQKVFGPV